MRFRPCRAVALPKHHIVVGHHLGRGRLLAAEIAEPPGTLAARGIVVQCEQPAPVLARVKMPFTAVTKHEVNRLPFNVAGRSVSKTMFIQC